MAIASVLTDDFTRLTEISKGRNEDFSKTDIKRGYF